MISDQYTRVIFSDIHFDKSRNNLSESVWKTKDDGEDTIASKQPIRKTKDDDIKIIFALFSLFVSQSLVLFSHTKSASTISQSALLFSDSKSASANSHN